MKSWVLLLAAAASAMPPTITSLQPRGAQKGRPFKLTVVGRDLVDVVRIHSTLPAGFTPLAPEIPAGAMGAGRYATFLVEPKPEAATGVYPIRIETAGGISNVQLFSIGDLPEMTEDESEPGAPPNRNDSMENAQSLPSSAVTVTGSLRGPERDFYRLQGKAGERRVVEVEARRVGSAIDPVLRFYDQSGKVLAKSEDTPMLGLDARVDVKLPRDGYYYVELHDARFSTQATNFYRLKTGSYDYATDIYPLGGRRGEAVDVSLGAETLKVTPSGDVTFVSLPGSPALPLPFDVGEHPEVREPVPAELTAPVTINGRLEKPGEVDRYKLNVTPGERLMVEVRARELGTSKLMAIVTVSDPSGKRIARSGDEPLPEDFYTVGQSATAGDPYVFFEVPKDVHQIEIAIEDLAERGGPHFAYRILAAPSTEDFRLNLNTPYVNVPEGGSINVPVTMDRRGYLGDVRLRVKNPPKGLIVEGGYIPPQNPSYVQGNRGQVRTGVLMLSAEPGVRLPPVELEVEGVGTLPDGREIVRRAIGPGMMVAVNGATLQGSVDRQRALTAPWMGMRLPAAGTNALPARLAVTLEKTTHKETGDEFLFRWKWTGPAGLDYPNSVTADMVSAADIRAIEMQQDRDDPTTGTFLVTTTKLTLPGEYDFYITGRLKHMDRDVVIYSRPIKVTVQEARENAVSEAR